MEFCQYDRLRIRPFASEININHEYERNKEYEEIIYTIYKQPHRNGRFDDFV